MLTVYVYDNSLIENGDLNNSTEALIAEQSGFETNADAEEWFNENYGSNDYSMSYTK